MDLIPVVTHDGSITFKASYSDEHYHSVNGAITESEYVFIEMGLKNVQKKEIRIFEIGFGTGLNAFLSLMYAVKTGKLIDYQSIEFFPLKESDYSILNYTEFYPTEFKDSFYLMHRSPWNISVNLGEKFQLRKINADLVKYTFPPGQFDLVFFDAFSPAAQPEMWTEKIFEKIHGSMYENGTLVTYSASGIVKRALLNTGFTLEKLKGPPGKRHMLRAKKLG